jgi:hypothetical protein
MECIKQIFPNTVMLKEIKRLKKEEDKVKMKNLKEAIFKGVAVEKICEDYGIKTINKMEDVKTRRNIAYFTFRCNQVNARVHKQAGSSKAEVEGIQINNQQIIQKQRPKRKIRNQRARQNQHKGKSQNQPEIGNTHATIQ